jgi:anti-sigma factor RsiW
MNRNDLTCHELVELVTEYLEGALSPSEHVRVEAHLRGCGGCRAYLAQMRQTVRALGRLTEEAIPETMKQELLRLFRDWKRSH